MTLNSSSESSGTRNAPWNAVPRSSSLLSTPSSTTLVWSLRAPFTAPLRLSAPGLMCALFPVKTTPGCRLRIPVGSRPSNGRFAIWSAPNAWPKVASCVFTSGAVPITSTVSATEETFMVTFTVPGVFTRSSTFGCRMVANPAAVVVTT